MEPPARAPRVDAASGGRIADLVDIAYSDGVAATYFAARRRPNTARFHAYLSRVSIREGAFVLCIREATARPVAGFLTHDDGRITFAVRPRARRRGLARALIEAALHRAGGGPIEALVDRTNHASIALLEACGFHFAGLDTVRGATHGRETASLYVRPATATPRDAPPPRGEADLLDRSAD